MDEIARVYGDIADIADIVNLYLPFIATSFWHSGNHNKCSVVKMWNGMKTVQFSVEMIVLKSRYGNVEYGQHRFRLACLKLVLEMEIEMLLALLTLWRYLYGNIVLFYCYPMDVTFLRGTNLKQSDFILLV